MSGMSEMMAFVRETELLSQVQGRLSWDQETVMPRGAAEQRGEEMAALEGVLHARRTDPRLGEWLEEARPEGEVEAAHVRHLKRRWLRDTRVPAALAAELARVTSVGQGVWAEARGAEDVAAFLPTLARIVELRREEGRAIADGGMSVYEALLRDYEPGATEAGIAELFDGMRPRLTALRDRVLGAGSPPELKGEFPEAAQLSLAREIAGRFGYDMNHGRIDLAAHPFSSGSAFDVRITTRVSEDPFNCLYSTIHEVGHATYERNIRPDFAFTPLGAGVSMGVHESQSRSFENQIGRSPAFARFLFGRMTDIFGDIGVADAGTFARTVNRVDSGFIRTEADEVHYNLHIMLRFDLERRLVSGEIGTEDIEEAWNARFAADFGRKVDRPSNGILQDVHWSVGLFGYFPTYALGNVYAGCLAAAMRRDLPGLDSSLEAGDPSPATGWLKRNLQVHGGLREPPDAISFATGETPDETPLLDYLDEKFGALYDL